MKIILNLQLIILFVLCTQLFGVEETFYASQDKAAKITTLEEQYFGWGILGHNVGFKKDENRNEMVRTQYTFDLSSIPFNANIDSVELYFDWGGFGDYIPITKITHQIDHFSGAEETYNLVKSSNSVFGSVPYGTTFLTSSSLTTKVNDAKGGNFYLGAMSLNEANSGPPLYLEYWAGLSLSLVVDYYIPVTITADNNFSVTGGSNGTVKVDGSTKTAPYSFSKLPSTNLTLEAISSQTDIQGYQRVWASCELSDWTRNGVHRSYAQLYSFEVAEDDNGKTYKANLAQVTATTNGTVSSSEEWFTNVTLTGNVTVPSGVTLTLTSCSSVNLDNYSILSTGGTITVESGAGVNPYYSVNEVSEIKGIYPTLNSAMANVTSGQNVLVHTSTTLDNNITVPSGVIIYLKSGTTTTLNSYTITNAPTGQIVLENQITIVPDIRLQTGSSVKGLYTSIISALSASSTGQIVHARGAHTLTADLTVYADKNLTIHPGAQLTFEDYREMRVYGTLDAQGTSSNKITFTSADGTSNNSENAYLVRLRNSGSDNSILNYCIFKNAQRGVYFDNSEATIQNSEITRCGYGIYNYYSDSHINSNDINNTSYGIYNYYSSPKIGYNDINSTSMGIQCESYSSPDLAWSSNGHNNLYGGFITFGVYAENNSNPYLGNGSCGNDVGRNIFDYDNFDLALAYAGSNCFIMAQNNYWGTSNPGSYMFGGDVDWQPFLTSPPSGSQQSSPETTEFDMAFSTTSSEIEPLGTNILSLYDPDWTLNKKTQFIQISLYNGEKQDVQQLCKDIINDYPDSAKAFFALDLLYQASRPKTMSKGYDLDSFKEYLLTLSQMKDKKTVYGSAELILAGLEKEKGIARIDNVFKTYRDTYLSEAALFQKFMYYYNENGDDKTSREVLADLEAQFPSSRYTIEAYHILGEKLDDVYECNLALKKTSSPVKGFLTILPKKYVLHGAYPNPFNPSTTIKYALPYASDISISIYNMSGQKIKDLELLNQSAGTHKAIWDGKTNNSVKAASGIYIVKFKAGSNEATKEIFEKSIKITLLK